jgi:hypothetical protein
MKIFTKHLFTFTLFFTLHAILNIAVFWLTFYSVVTDNTGENSPTVMLKKIAVYSDKNEITAELKNKLKRNNIWEMFYIRGRNCCLVF